MFFILASCSKGSENSKQKSKEQLPQDQLNQDHQKQDQYEIIKLITPNILNNIELNLIKNAPFTPVVIEAFELIKKNENLFYLFKFDTSEAIKIKIIDSTITGDNSEYNPEEQQIVLSKGDCDNKLNDVIAKSFKGVFIHEIAHSVLRKNFTSDLSHEIEATQGNDKKRFKLIFKNQFQEADNLAQSVFAIMSPFDEFLADLYSVLLSNNPEIISNFQLNCQPETDLQDLRDFSKSYSAIDWNNGCLGGGIMCSSHSVFNPTRSEIWKIYQQMKDSPEIREKLMNVAYTISIEMIKEIVSKGTTYSQWKQSSIGQLNIDFINRLNQVSFK